MCWVFAALDPTYAYAYATHVPPFAWENPWQLSRRPHESPMFPRFAILYGGSMAHDGPQPQEASRGSQLELFGGGPAPSCGPNPDEMRELLHSLLAEAREARIMPWPPLSARHYRLLFPQLTFWLPEDEGAQLRFEFEAELARLEAT